jgi:hypothetical protein
MSSSPPGDAPPDADRRPTGGVIGLARRTLAKGLKAVTLLYLFVVAWPVVSEGLRLALPAMGQRLHRQPGLGFLRNYENFHRTDPAHLTAAALLVAVCWLWAANIRVWMVWDHPRWVAEKWDPDVYGRLVQVLAAVLLSADALLFFYGVSHAAAGSWDATGVPYVGAALFTVGYVAGTVCAAFLSVTLDRE